MISVDNQAEYALLQKLASFYKHPKKAFVKERFKETPVYSYPVVREIFSVDSPWWYSVRISGKVSLAELTTPKKWLKSEIREAYWQGAEFNSPYDYVLSVFLPGTVWAVQEAATNFDGITTTGGVLVKDEERETFMFLQPVHSFLFDRHGVLFGDEE